jgi:uncharacterized protein (TIGR02118 family)
MPVKIVVLYPHPNEPQSFERAYFAEHMPLMRSAVTPASRTPTFTILGKHAPFYRMAEVHYPDLAALRADVQSESGLARRHSSEKVSTGGPPIFLVCQADT